MAISRMFDPAPTLAGTFPSLPSHDGKRQGLFSSRWRSEMIHLNELYRDSVILLGRKEAAGLAFDQITLVKDIIAGANHLVSKGIIALPIQMATNDETIKKYTILIARDEATMQEMLTHLRAGLSHGGTLTVLNN
jgi:hypothetical protein